MKKLTIFSFILLWALPSMACDGCLNYIELKQAKERYKQLEQNLTYGNKLQTLWHKKIILFEMETLDGLIDQIIREGYNDKEEHIK